MVGLRDSIPRTVIDCARASAGRICAAHRGAGGYTCYRRCCRNWRDRWLETFRSAHVGRSPAMTHAIRFYKTGGPEVLIWEEIQFGNPLPLASTLTPATCA